MMTSDYAWSPAPGWRERIEEMGQPCECCTGPPPTPTIHGDIRALVEERDRLREAIECACAAAGSPVMWENFERVKLGVPQIMDVLHEKLRDEVGP